MQLLFSNIKKYRLDRGLSAKELSLLADVSINLTGRLEKGCHKSPYFSTIYKLATALGVPIEFIVHEYTAIHQVKKHSNLEKELSDHIDALPLSQKMMLNNMLKTNSLFKSSIL